eukprot:2996927-Pyramimonas_sp.AAC.1
MPKKAPPPPQFRPESQTVGPPPAKTPRVEGDLAASPPPGGKGTAGGQPWKPSTRDPPPALTEFIGTNVSETPPIDQSHQSAEPQYKFAPRV